MHEGGYTSQIVSAILGELKKYPGRKVKSAHVLVGEMLHLEPESVRMHFELSSKGTALEGMQLTLEEIPVRVSCAHCNLEVEVSDHHHLVCAKCGSADVELADGGDKVFIDSIEFD